MYCFTEDCSFSTTVSLVPIILLLEESWKILWKVANHDGGGVFGGIFANTLMLKSARENER